MPKPTKPEPTKNNADIVRAGIQTEFWKLISSYLGNELAELSYAIIKKRYKDKDLNESELDALRRNLDFVEWHLNLPQLMLDSVEAEEPEIPDYDPYNDDPNEAKA